MQETRPFLVLIVNMLHFFFQCRLLLNVFSVVKVSRKYLILWRQGMRIFVGNCKYVAFLFQCRLLLNVFSVVKVSRKYLILLYC